MSDSSLRQWHRLALVSALVIVLAVPLYVARENLRRNDMSGAVEESATFVGREKCVDCHQDAYQSWLGSDHDRAMAEATDSTVLADFDNADFVQGDITARFYREDRRFYVRTQGPDGALANFEIVYTFGVEPLQQYLVQFPGGRLQSLTIAWDTERKRWFYLYPDADIPPGDWLHWTRNGQNWNGMCAECHSTNLIKNYNPASQTFATTWSEIDVSCEACHGPGSEHVDWAELPPMARPETENYDLLIPTSGTSSRAQVELCAPCHSRRTELGDYDHTRPDLLDNILPAVLEEPIYHADGQILDEVYVYGSFVQSKMYRNNVRCGDCHDVHSLKLVKEGNDLCLQCHQGEVYDSYDHHFHQREFEGKPSDGYLCVKCHMPEQPYMVVDWRADHSLRVPRPDLTAAIGTPNACLQSGCHDDKPNTWAVEHFEKWYGVARKPHYGTTLAAGRKHDPDAHDQLVLLAGNYLYPAMVRATALTLLSAYPGDQTTEAFNRALTDSSALVRHTAISSLNVPDPDRFVELVSPLLFDPVRAVRMQAAVQLADAPEHALKPYQHDALDSALADYVRAMEYSLDFSFAGHNLGGLYTRLGNAERAEANYVAALEVDDLFFPPKVNLAMLYNAQGRNGEAETLLREVVRDYPEEYEVAYSLGLLLAELNRLDEAVEFLAAAAAGLPERARISYNLGLAQQSLGNQNEAEAALRHAVSVEPANIDFLFALADHYIKRGLPDRALPVAEQIIEYHPQNRLGHELKAVIEGSPSGSSPR